MIIKKKERKNWTKQAPCFSMKHDNQIFKVPSTYYINDIVYNLYPAKEKETKVPVTIPLISLK